MEKLIGHSVLAILVCSAVLPSVVFLSVVFLSGCGPKKVYEYYQPSYRQLPPEQVYSRVTVSHLPQPVPVKARTASPLIMPEVYFDLPSSSLQEAIEALAQTIGYDWRYPRSAAKRPVALKMVGTIEEVLREISKQAGVRAVLDHENRLVKVVDGSLQPRFR